LWEIREGIAMATNQYGLTLSYDVSLPTKEFYRIVAETRSLIENSSELSQS